MFATPFFVLALCGLAIGALLPVPRIDGRITGGKPTTIKKYPYQLSLRSSGYHICGASIIGPYHALTAAHCVTGASPRIISLHAGTSYQSQGGSKRQAKKIISHPLYRGNDYDFAIIEVATPFPIGKVGVQSVELCTVEPSAGQTAVITGWGAFSTSGGSPNLLHVVNVPVITRAACQKKYSRYSITQRMICAAMANGNRDVCQADPGGPLIVNGKQCGVVSWSTGCDHRNYTGVYSNVADQLSWIQKTVRM